MTKSMLTRQACLLEDWPLKQLGITESYSMAQLTFKIVHLGAN